MAHAFSFKLDEVKNYSKSIDDHHSDPEDLTVRMKDFNFMPTIQIALDGGAKNTTDKTHPFYEIYDQKTGKISIEKLNQYIDISTMMKVTENQRSRVYVSPYRACTDDDFLAKGILWMEDE